jgi:hypothetical protein
MAVIGSQRFTHKYTYAQLFIRECILCLSQHFSSQKKILNSVMHEQSYLLQYNHVYSAENQPTFQKIVLSLTSESKDN